MWLVTGGGCGFNRVMTPPAEAGGFSGNGMSNLDRWRLKAPSEPCSQVKHVPGGVQVAPQDQATDGTPMDPLSQRLGHVLAALRTALRRTGRVHGDRARRDLTVTGIRPLVTINHMDLPQVLDVRGGWVARDVAG